MTAEEREYVLHRIRQSQESMRVAEVCLTEGLTMTAVNRIYYGCFYLVSALLLCEGLASSKHSGVRSLFDQHWVKTGRLPSEFSRFYRKMLKRRHSGDYIDLASFDLDEVRTWYEEARNFESCLNEQIGR
ncbi:MAG TPA: HEPN domain-containing protein, partial [Candidatus Hydrogenedentes bacterium]|nr:HEPN domain-containing protein [Candidatus Hydrogenedentota bacterium]